MQQARHGLSMEEHLGILRGSSTASASEVQPDPDQASTSSAPSQEAPPQGFIRHQVLGRVAETRRSSACEKLAQVQLTSVTALQIQRTDNLAGLAIRYNVTVWLACLGSLKLHGLAFRPKVHAWGRDPCSFADFLMHSMQECRYAAHVPCMRSRSSCHIT